LSKAVEERAARIGGATTVLAAIIAGIFSIIKPSEDAEDSRVAQVAAPRFAWVYSTISQD